MLKMYLLGCWLVQAVSGATIVAHRGVHFDETEAFCLPENSLDAVLRAFSTSGVGAVELDMRVTSDGDALVFHDKIGNVRTDKDNSLGTLNSVDVALHIQKDEPAILVANAPARDWANAALKTYGPDAKLLAQDPVRHPLTIYAMLAAIKGRTNGKLVFLDAQTWNTMDTAARAIKQLGMQDSVIIKFFAARALAPQLDPYTGANTCYDYARRHGLSGIKIAPAFLDGELDGGSGKIKAFGAVLTVGAYLDCWASAEKDHAGNGAAIVAMVEATPPANPGSRAVPVIMQAVDWARANKRPTISFVGMPDACRIISGKGQLFVIPGEQTTAFSFSYKDHQFRSQWANKYSDYIIIDVMGNHDAGTMSYEWDHFTSFLC